jgi:hypothetical protein
LLIGTVCPVVSNDLLFRLLLVSLAFFIFSSKNCTVLEVILGGTLFPLGLRGIRFVGVDITLELSTKIGLCCLLFTVGVFLDLSILGD